MAKPLKVDHEWLNRIGELLNEMEFGSLNIVVHEGQIVQVDRTERKRFEIGPARTANVKTARQAAARRPRESGQR